MLSLNRMRLARKFRARAKVLVADDNEAMHGLVRRILEPEFEVVEFVRNGRDLIETALELRPDVLLVDVSMPELGGLEAVRQLQRLHREKGWITVVFTVHDDRDLIVQALQAGAAAYVLKCRAGEDLLRAVRAALEGRRFVSRAGEAA